MSRHGSREGERDVRSRGRGQREVHALGEDRRRCAFRAERSRATAEIARRRRTDHLPRLCGRDAGLELRVTPGIAARHTRGATSVPTSERRGVLAAFGTLCVPIRRRKCRRPRLRPPVGTVLAPTGRTSALVRPLERSWRQPGAPARSPGGTVLARDRGYSRLRSSTTAVPPTGVRPISSKPRAR